jgi:lipid A disaccharide synthetase
MDKEIVPELIQAKAKSTIIAQNILTILNDQNYRENMISELSNVKKSLTTPNSASNVANAINSSI